MTIVVRSTSLNVCIWLLASSCLRVKSSKVCQQLLAAPNWLNGSPPAGKTALLHAN